MTRKYDDLPFEVGQEVEAKFNENGYRGAWFRCRILEIKVSGAISKLLLQYLDFPEEEGVISVFRTPAYKGGCFQCWMHPTVNVLPTSSRVGRPPLDVSNVESIYPSDSWAAVRQAGCAVKEIEPWSKKKKPLIWMVRPEPQVIHERNVEKYQEDIRMGRKSPGDVHIYNDLYVVGDHVDWFKDDCFWGARIVEINDETKEAKLKFPPPPLGEGDGSTHMAPLKDLRPSFLWNPKHGWRQLGLKRKEAGTSVMKCKSDKRHIQLVHLSGDSKTIAVVSDERCGPFSLGNTSSVCKSEPDGPAFNARATPRKERYINSDFHELDVISDKLHEEPKCVLVLSQSTSDSCHGTKKLTVYDRVKLRKDTTKDGAKSSIKKEAPLKLEKGRRRMVRFTSSFDISDSNEEEQRSWQISQNAAEVLNLIPSTTHALRLDASTTPSQPVSTREPEDIDGVLELDRTPGHLRNGAAVGDSMNDSVATANQDLLQVKSVVSDTALENGVSAKPSTSRNAGDRKDGTSVPELVGDKTTLPVGSSGSCPTMENADGLGDQTAEVHGDDTSDVRSQVHLLIPGNVLENTPSPDSIAEYADSLSGARAEVYSPAHDEFPSPREEITDSIYEFHNTVAEDARSESRFKMRSPVSTDTSTALKNPLSTDGTISHTKEIMEKPHDFEGVVAKVHQTASDHGTLFCVPDGTQVPLRNSTGDADHGGSKACAPRADNNERQVTRSEANVVTKGGCAPISGRKKLSCHRICVAIKKAIDIGRSRKRRRENDQLKTSRKRLCQINTNRGVNLSVFQADAFTEDPLSSSVPPTPTNNEKKSSVFGSIVKPEPGTYEEENRMLVIEDSSPEPLWVLALPRIRQGKFPAIIRSTPSTTPSDTEQRCPGSSLDSNDVHVTAPNDCPDNSPDFNCFATAPCGTEQIQYPPVPAENSDLEGDLVALERLIARVHVLGAHLQRGQVQKPKRIVWKTSEGSVFFSGEGEGGVSDEEAKDFDVAPHSGDNSALNYVPKWYLRSVFSAVSGKAPDGEADAHCTAPCSDGSDPECIPERLPCVSAEATNTPQEGRDPNPSKVSLDSSGSWGRKSRGRRKVTNRATKRMKSLRSLVTCKTHSLRQSEPANQLLLVGSGNVSSKVNSGIKRKQVDNMGPGNGSKKMRANESTALVEAVRYSATPAEVELPRMRGSIRHSKGIPVRLHKSKTSQKPSSQGKYLDANMDRKEQVVESIGFQREQQVDDPHCGHLKQKSVEKSSLSGFPTKSHLSNGSNHEISSLGKSGSEALEGESEGRKNWHQSRGNSGSEVLDNESEENKIKLQTSGNWCIKAFTVDGKIEWIGNFSTKEEALTLYNVINRSSSLNEKGVPPPSHTSSSCLREHADGNHLTPEPPLNEKPLKCSTLAKRTEGNASESSSTFVEPNVEYTMFIGREVNETGVGVSTLAKISGAVEKEDKGDDAGALENINKSAEACEQDSSVISTKEDAAVGLGVETSSVFTIGDIQGRTNTGVEATAPILTEGSLGLSSKEKYMNSDKDIQAGGIVQDKPVFQDNSVVKVEVSEPQAVAGAGNAHDTWIHDAVQCRYGKDALDRVSLHNFDTTEEIEVARQVKMALWRGLCCSRESCGLGLDLCKRIQLLLQSRMLFQTLIDGDSEKILLTTGKPCEEIYLGNYKNETEFSAARRIISRCKKELQKSMVFFKEYHNTHMTSDVLQTQVPHAGASQVMAVSKETSSSLPESTEQHTRPSSASQARAQPGVQGFTISREFWQSSTRPEISPKLSTAPGDSTPVPKSEDTACHLTPLVTCNDRNPSVEVSSAPVTVQLPCFSEGEDPKSSGAVAGPPCPLHHVIVLDDDDDDEVQVAPVSSLLPGSTSSRGFTGVTHVRNNVSAQRETSVQGNRTSRTDGLLNDVVFSYPRQAQEERFHLVGCSSAGGRISVRQTVPNDVQTVNARTDPIQGVGHSCGTRDAQIYRRTGLQPVRQEELRSQQTIMSPPLFGNVVGQPQPVNPYCGTVLVNVLSPSGQLVEIPSSSLQAMQGHVRVSTPHAPVNRPRELGDSTSGPTAFNISVTAAPTSAPESRVYHCCTGFVASEQDFKIFQALLCANCNRTMHTDCAIASKQLSCLVGSQRIGIGKEKAVYICTCGKKWEIIPIILSRMKKFAKMIWDQQKERLNRDTAPVTVMELEQGPELLVIMGTLYKILSGVRSDHTLKTIFQYLQHMSRLFWEDANRVNFLEWINFIDAALKLICIDTAGSGHFNQTAGHG